MNILKVLTERRKVGNFGEDAAAKLLQKQGYKILERGYVGKNAEIDLIVKDSEFTVFVEVKTRKYGKYNPFESRPASAVTPAKQRAIIGAARDYLAFNHTECKLRFDIVEVLYDGEGKDLAVRETKHLVGAFNLNTATKGYRK